MLEFVRGTHRSDESGSIRVETVRNTHRIDVIAGKLVGYVRHTQTAPAAEPGQAPQTTPRTPEVSPR